MARIQMEKQFTMPLNEVKTGLEKIAKSLEKNQGMAYEWTSDSEVSFSHKSGKGSIAIEGDKLRMELKLGLMYAAVAPVVRKKVMDYADKYVY